MPFVDELAEAHGDRIVSLSAALRLWIAGELRLPPHRFPPLEVQS